MDPINLPNFKSVALPVPELIGVAQKFGAVLGYAHTLYSSQKSYTPTIQAIHLCTLVFHDFPLEFRVGLRTSNLGGRGWA